MCTVKIDSIYITVVHSVNRNVNSGQKQCQMDSIDDRPKLKVVYSNADNLMNKRQELEVLIALQNPDIICVTEVVPKNTSLPVQICELQIQGYEPLQT